MQLHLAYADYDALDLAELVKNNEITPHELLAEAQRRLKQLNPSLNAVVCPMDELAESLVESLDKQSVFCGVPFLVKDLKLPFEGYPMSNGSAAMKDYITDTDSALTKKLKSSGLIPFGKTNTSELGTSSLVTPTAFGPTNNPWDIKRNSGGSSGGSSAAVAARIVPMAYSSDGGGSIRLPASYCGIFGLKPSRKINHYEDMSTAWGGAVVSHVSSISVRDSAAYLDLVTDKTTQGYDTDHPPADSYLLATQRPPERLTIGFITASPTNGAVHPECIHAAQAAANYCEQLGHDVVESQWHFDGMALMRAFLTIVFKYTRRDVDAIANLLHIDTNNLDLELNTRFMNVVGRGITNEQEQRALNVWQETAIKMAELHQQYDVILTPTVATPPLAHRALDPNGIEKLLMHFMIKTGLGKYILNNQFLDTLIHKSINQTPFTPIANITGQPAMSVPLYWDNHNIPHGAQFMAIEGNDSLLFQLASQLEQLAPWKNKIPTIAR